MITEFSIEELKLAGASIKETALEKTARVSREISDDENEIRRAKIERLKRSRLQYRRDQQ